ncbi:hydrogenase assembly protein HupF [Nocardia sp. alder85J]|uniref:hydrogenase assembly protein HupF n=1 Tax=Nocardia sp. alder85J TaxID=2862949 RepID=UPI001CD20145|nr:hydrogenase assembly protein HupF [Nocardia sp. alder85J]MCX4098096.1 hydrogenase assembly protein HupF [Nocardia sp. alder85J]
MSTTAIDHELDAEPAADLAATALALARRFTAGATLWCVAPSWEPHAQHIAVEFVHPVIVGKRALPAVALTGPDPVRTARVSARAGDVLIAVSGADDPEVCSLMLRAPAWGVTTIWIGNGPRPPAGAADHLLWFDDPDRRMPAAGGFVLAYHLLWELTHVCLEHPVPPPEYAPDACITCSDEGRLGEVIATTGDTATVRTATGVETVATTLVGVVSAGDLLLVHAGTAIGAVGGEAR